jgi:hypothetical protein
VNLLGHHFLHAVPPSARLANPASIADPAAFRFSPSYELSVWAANGYRPKGIELLAVLARATQLAERGQETRSIAAWSPWKVAFRRGARPVGDHFVEITVCWHHFRHCRYWYHVPQATKSPREIDSLTAFAGTKSGAIAFG